MKTNQPTEFFPQCNVAVAQNDTGRPQTGQPQKGQTHKFAPTTTHIQRNNNDDGGNHNRNDANAKSITLGKGY